MKRIQLLGTQRSGSNLLRLIVGALPRALAPPSAHKLRDFQDLIHRYVPLNDPVNRRKLVAHLGALVDLNVLSWPRIDNRTDAVVDAMTGDSLAHAVVAYYDAHARWFGATAWLSKCLENVRFVDQLHATGLPILYVHLVRDPRDVAVSFRNAPIGPKDPRIIALHWRDLQREAGVARSIVGDENWLTIRYEDLVAKPAAALEDLCRTAALEWHDDALEFYRRSEAVTTAGLSTLWTNLDRPVSRNRVGTHKTGADPDFVAAVESLTCDFMEAHGYVPIHATGLAALSASEKAAAERADQELRFKLQESRDPDSEQRHLERERYLLKLKDGPDRESEKK